MATLWALSFVWLAALAYGLARGSMRLFSPLVAAVDTRFIVATAACGVVFAAAVWWGWPGPGWPLDELEPKTVIDGWRRGFSGGWYDKYPPVYFYLLAVTYTPVIVAEHFGRASTLEVPVGDMLYLLSRLVSLVLSLGTVVMIGLLAVRLGYRRFAWLAVLLAGFLLPMPFYAKTANVEAPYLFFFAASLLFCANAETDGRFRDFIGLGISAALAVTTKDQAYAVYVLPGLYLGGRALMGGVGAPRKTHVLAAGAVCVVTWALAHNVVFNPAGFRGHLLTIVGPAATDYRMFERSLSGQLPLLAAVCRQTWDCLSWAGIVAAVLGLAMIRARGLPSIPLWLWLTLPSYYFSFVAIVGYSYDRFLMPLILIFAIPAAVGLGHLLERAAASRWRQALGACLLGWILMRAVGVDVLMMNDARYAAEAWLQREVPVHAVVGSFSQTAYLPRLTRFTHRQIRATIDDTLAQAPDFIVINSEHIQRYAQDSPRMAWLHWLESGSGPYQEVFRYKAPVPWYSPLALDSRLRDRVEDPYSNLDKINPEITIFRRR